MLGLVRKISDDVLVRLEHRSTYGRINARSGPNTSGPHFSSRFVASANAFADPSRLGDKKESRRQARDSASLLPVARRVSSLRRSRSTMRSRAEWQTNSLRVLGRGAPTARREPPHLRCTTQRHCPCPSRLGQACSSARINMSEITSPPTSGSNSEAELPPELALIGRIIDRLGPRARSIGGCIRWVVDGAPWRLDLEVDGGRWLRDGEDLSTADATVKATAEGVRALFGGPEDLRKARLSGGVVATGDLTKLTKIGAALREGGSFLTHRARRNAR
jgi:SCP-2 sterol transfer family protein